VRLSFSGSVTRFRFEDSGADAGLLVSNTLSQLANEFSTVLTATTCPRKLRRDSARTASDSRIRRGPVRIIVYGILAEKDAIAELLSSDGMFLQHPAEAEYDKRVEYLNPQYLLRPGAGMPRLEGLSGFSGRGLMGALEEPPLGEMERSQVLQIFESARGPDLDIASEIKPSTRLASALKP
jgi:hypothetical protein